MCRQTRPGLADMGEWIFANSNKNPIPTDPPLRGLIPGGRLDNAANGMIQIWTGAATGAYVPNFNAAKPMTENNKTMYSAGAAYSFDTGGLHVE